MKISFSHPSKQIAAVMFISLACMFTAFQTNAQDCTCTNCPQFMPDNFMGNFTINVMGAANNQLGQNGQGVCGVTINFDHEYIGDLSIVLTSPGGQSVQLIGPIGLFGMTDFTSWDIAFVPCNDPAAPDPGFAQQWSNNQPWGLFGNYSGTYYPNQGCLENFNSGPVNGTWTLTVTDGQANDVGNFYDYEIIFCDPTGILCFTCAADAGTLNEADVSACQGSQDLILTVNPTYIPPAVQPPAGEYSYDYIIAGAGGIILEYSSSPDLSGYDPGNYTVCGFSYYSGQFDLIPPPDGSLTIAQLSNLLSSPDPPICGDISSDCINVSIFSAPPDEEEIISICAPDYYFFHGQNYCLTGMYTIPLVSADGCEYTATLDLTVHQLTITNLNETICDGECATTPGFESYCTPGNHQEVFISQFNCDSIVNLNLQTLQVMASIQTPDSISCSQPSIVLDGTGSSVGASVTYHWTASNGGHIVTGANSLMATVDAPGEYQLEVCKTGGGLTCCDIENIEVFADNDASISPDTILSPAGICQGDTVTFVATSVPNALEYLWYLPSGVIPVSSLNSDTISVIWSISVDSSICVAAINSCDTSTQTCLDITLGEVPAPDHIIGDTAVCQTTQYLYHVPVTPGILSYNWSVIGGNIISGQTSDSVLVEWFGSAGELCVQAVNNCGFSGDTCIQIAAMTAPEQLNIFGPELSCPGAEQLYWTDTIPTADNYIWQISNGTLLSGQGSDTALVSWNGTSNVGQICVAASNFCGTGPDSCINVTLSPPKGSVPTFVCDSTNQNYTVSFVISGGVAPYSVAGQQLSDSLFVSSPILAGQPYSFFITDSKNCISEEIAGSYDCNCSTFSGFMDNIQLAACEGETISAIFLGSEVLDGNDVGAFYLHDGAGSSLGTIYDQNTSGVFGLSTGMLYETVYYVSFVTGNDLNGFPDLSDPCLSVSTGQPIIFHQNPVAYAGIDLETCADTLVMGANLPVNSLGHWSVLTGNQPDITIENSTDPQSAVTTLSPGVYTLEWTVTTNGCSNSDTTTISFYDSPAVSDIQFVCDAANEFYTVQLTLSGGNLPYSVNGSVIPDSIYHSIAIVSGQSYSFLVSDTQGCSLPLILGSHLCNCSTDAGTMSPNLISKCVGQNIVVTSNNDYTLDANDVFSYILHDGSGNVLGQVFDQNFNGVFSLKAGMNPDQTYYVSLVVGNANGTIPDQSDPCFSVSVGQPVVWLQYPDPNAGIDASVCGDSTVLNADSSGYNGIWTKVLGPGTATFSNPTDPESQVSVSTFGLYIFQWTETNGACKGSDQVIVRFNQVPTLDNLSEDCNGTNTGYTVSFTVENGSSPYTANGFPGSFQGNLFTSSIINNNEAYSIEVTDGNGCLAGAVSGNHFCPCSTYAGTLDTSLQIFCADDPALAIWNNNAVLDTDDTIQFVLHDISGPGLGTILATNNQPIFSFGPGLQTGITYYISVVAGSNIAGAIDLTDDCLSVSPGAPVQWKDIPMAFITGDTSICSGDTALLTFSGTGSFPLELFYSDGNSQLTLSILDSQAVSLGILPQSSTTYSLFAVEDGSLPVCSAALNQSVSIMVGQGVTAGEFTDTIKLCSGVDTTYNLFSLLTGADANGNWIEISDMVSPPGAFDTSLGTFTTGNLNQGLFSFKYLVAAQTPCFNDSSIITIEIAESPVADAGPDQVIDCDNPSATLGGPSTSSGQYIWFHNGQIIDSVQQVSVQEGGAYTLQVTNDSGCSQSDEAVIQADNQAPNAELISAEDISCFGEIDGVIAVDSFTSVHFPVLYALNNEPFQQNPIFTNLEPGTYVLHLMDANGCVSSDDTIQINQALNFTSELGPDIQVSLGDSVLLHVETGVPINSLDTILWQPLYDQSPGRIISEQHFLPLESGVVSVQVIDSNGCFKTDQIMISVLKPKRVYIPNVFNPGSDLNSSIYIFAGKDVAMIEYWSIYDRWGSKLFELNDFLPNDPAYSWDGTYRGSLLNPGVFVYEALVRFVNGETTLYKGDITLIR